MGVKSEEKKEDAIRENNRRIKFRLGRLVKFAILCKLKDK